MAATEPTLGISLEPLDQPSDYARLTSAILRLYEETGLDPEDIVTDDDQDCTYDPVKLRSLVADPSVKRIWIWHDRVPELSLFLRPRNPHDQEYVVRTSHVISARLPVALTPPVRDLLAALVEVYPIARGSVAGYRTAAYAGKECSDDGAFGSRDIDETTAARLRGDPTHVRPKPDKLLRLYPVTIIGAAIWARLPPMPRFDPMPVVEDLGGGCKMLVAWPELVEPRDPAFLAGTVELRRWLWPYTIQNPADDPALG